MGIHAHTHACTAAIGDTAVGRVGGVGFIMEGIGGRAVPPLTIAEAGQACVCRSQAWDAKIVTSAWWVEHHQVRTLAHPSLSRPS